MARLYTEQWKAFKGVPVASVKRFAKPGITVQVAWHPMRPSSLQAPLSLCLYRTWRRLAPKLKGYRPNLTNLVAHQLEEESPNPSPRKHPHHGQVHLQQSEQQGERAPL